MRTEWLISVTLTMFFSTGPAWGYHAAPTGNEEAVCSRPEVLMCDNFEDRNASLPLSGTGDWAKHTYKNSGWSISDINCTTISTVNAHDGTKALRFDYLAVPLPPAHSANACRRDDNGGAGFLQSFWPQSVNTIYARWYSWYSANWVRAVCEKGSIFGRSSTTNMDSHMFAGCGQVPYPSFGGTLAPFLGSGGRVNWDQNLNGRQNYALGGWQCFEVRITANSGPTTTDGYIQGWIDDIQHWEFPNNNSWSSGTATTLFNSIEFSAYWNCFGSIGPGTGCFSDPRNAHPDMVRYIGRVVVSTARIGCSGTPARVQAPVPAAPGPLLVH